MNQEQMFKTIISPHVSEKAVNCVANANQYVFKVAMDATKPEIKKAVEFLFTVKVNAVQVSRVKGKVKRFGSVMGKRSNWKKAYVTLADGNKIDILGAE